MLLHSSLSHSLFFKVHSQTGHLFSGKLSVCVLFRFLPDQCISRVNDAMGGGQARRAGSGAGGGGTFSLGSCGTWASPVPGPTHASGAWAPGKPKSGAGARAPSKEEARSDPLPAALP